MPGESGSIGLGMVVVNQDAVKGPQVKQISARVETTSIYNSQHTQMT